MPCFIMIRYMGAITDLFLVAKCNYPKRSTINKNLRVIFPNIFHKSIILLMDVQVPNVLGFVLGLIQMALYGIYRDKTKKEGNKKEVGMEGMKEVVVVVGVKSQKKSSEVFPDPMILIED